MTEYPPDIFIEVHLCPPDRSLRGGQDGTFSHRLFDGSGLFPIGEQPEGVEDDEQGRSLVEEDGDSHLQSEDRGGDQQEDHAQTEPEILLDDPAGLATETDRERKMIEIVGQNLAATELIMAL